MTVILFSDSQLALRYTKKNAARPVTVEQGKLSLPAVQCKAPGCFLERMAECWCRNPRCAPENQLRLVPAVWAAALSRGIRPIRTRGPDGLSLML